MISHLSLGVRDLDRAIAFFDAALAPIGVVRLWSDCEVAGYGPAGGLDCLALKLRSGAGLFEVPGFHVAFEAPDRASVDAFHAAGLRTGGRNEGDPRLRSQYGPDYYAAFLVDPDGHRIEAVHQAL